MLLEPRSCLSQVDPAGLEALCFKAGPRCVRSALILPRSALPSASAGAGHAAGSDQAPDRFACAALRGVAAGLLGAIQSP